MPASSSLPASSSCSLNLLLSSSSPNLPPWSPLLSGPSTAPWGVLRWTCLLLASLSPFASPFAFLGSSSLHGYPLRSTSTFNSTILFSIRSITSIFSLIASAQSWSPSSANSCNCWFDEWRCAIELRSSAALKCRLERGRSWMASAKRCGWIGVELDDMTVDYDCPRWEITDANDEIRCNTRVVGFLRDPLTAKCHF